MQKRNFQDNIFQILITLINQFFKILIKNYFNYYSYFICFSQKFITRDNFDKATINPHTNLIFISN